MTTDEINEPKQLYALTAADIDLCLQGLAMRLLMAYGDTEQQARIEVTRGALHKPAQRWQPVENVEDNEQ